MRRGLVILLILLVLVTGLPLLMGVDGMASCQTCEPAASFMACPALLVGAAVLFMVLVGRRVSRRHPSLRTRLLPGLLERPPQFAGV